MGGLRHPPRNSAQLLGGLASPPSNPNVMRWWSPPGSGLSLLSGGSWDSSVLSRFLAGASVCAISFSISCTKHTVSRKQHLHAHTRRPGN